MIPQRLNLNLLLTHKWLAIQHARERGPDVLGGMAWAVVGMLVVACLMVW